MVIGVIGSGIVAGVIGVVAMLVAGFSVLGALAFYPVAGLIGAIAFIALIATRSAALQMPMADTYELQVQ
jgi:FtsH-binding integral membrane protein